MPARPLDSFTIRLEMLSDWHVGTGYGDATVDRAVRRDRDGLPYVPGKTLRGVLRDACEQVAYGLDEGSQGPWHEVLEAVFGDQPSLRTDDPARPPRAGVLHLGDARLPEADAAVLRAKPALARATTFVKPGVKISYKTGAAEPQCLRFDEVARGGLELEAPAVLQLPADAPNAMRLAASALLVAGLARLERLGGKRRRGTGRVRALVAGMSEADRRELFELLRTDPDLASPSAAESTPAAASFASAAAGSGWVSLRVALTTVGPVCVPRRTVGNVIETLDRIPGYQLLPAVARALGATGVDLRPAITAGDLVVTDACIAIDGESALPAPRCLATEKKGAGGEVHNLFGNTALEQPRPLTGTYVRLHDGVVVVARPEISSTTHNSIDDDAQRPAGAGGVYTVEAIAPGTPLLFELRLREPVAEALSSADPAWHERLQGQWLLGAAKSAEYGRCEAQPLGEPAPVAGATRQVPSRATVWLTSDTLIRDDRLRPSSSPDAFAAALGRALGVGCRVIRAETDAARIESWQRSWGLPRPSLIGLAAGSAFDVEFDGSPDPARVAELEASGIGERRAEGFGQLRIAPPLPAEAARLEVASGVSTRREAPAGAASASSALDAIERAAWLDKIDAESARLAADPKFRMEALGLSLTNGAGVPPLSQVAALRNALGTVQGPGDGARFALDWLEHLKEVKNRAEKWDGGKLSSNERFERIRKLLRDTSRVWHLLEADEWAHELSRDSAAAASLKTDLWAYAVRAVADACCRAHKRDTEKRNGTAQGGGA